MLCVALLIPVSLLPGLRHRIYIAFAPGCTPRSGRSRRKRRAVVEAIPVDARQVGIDGDEDGRAVEDERERVLTRAQLAPLEREQLVARGVDRDVDRLGEV